MNQWIGGHGGGWGPVSRGLSSAAAGGRKSKSECSDGDGGGGAGGNPDRSLGGWGLVMCGTQWLGPTTEMVPKRLGIVNLRVPTLENLNVYGGSAFAVSPALSSLLL
ncbi:hypothetical protein TIFTF001_031150 [Ficus carica]|uniref:Uncharacterized protein n=1 Tax=Ficus carica TaxID=3494 RepID=A0AA88DUU4_FICCA|nr:hypothetical protein TIFTF001_031150 [Ficus carica]